MNLIDIDKKWNFDDPRLTVIADGGNLTIQYPAHLDGGGNWMRVFFSKILKKSTLQYCD